MTITISEFKNLIPVSQRESDVAGLYAINEKALKQCENLKVGDTVFFMKVDPGTLKLEDGKMSDIDITIMQATVVED